MAELVDLPGDGGHDAEFFVEELVTLSHVFDDFVVCWTSFIARDETSIDELEATLPQKVPDLLTLGLSLIGPPLLKEVNVRTGELLLWVIVEVVGERVEDVLHEHVIVVVWGD